MASNFFDALEQNLKEQQHRFFFHLKPIRSMKRNINLLESPTIVHQHQLHPPQLTYLTLGRACHSSMPCLDTKE